MATSADAQYFSKLQEMRSRAARARTKEEQNGEPENKVALMTKKAINKGGDIALDVAAFAAPEFAVFKPIAKFAWHHKKLTIGIIAFILSIILFIILTPLLIIVGWLGDY